MAEAEQCGHLVKILQASDDVRCREVVNLCMEYCLCGILDVSGTIQSSVRAEELRCAGIPLVLLDSTLPDQQSVRVVSDDPQGVSAAIRHLMDLGHRRIAHLAGHPIAGSAVSRREAYLSTMADAGLDVPEGYVDCHSYEPADANPAVARLLGRPDAPTALFCASDNLAMAAIRAARCLGVDVPRTLSVVGFAGLFMGELADPPLTTVAQPFEQMGREGMRAPLDGRTPPADIVLPAKLVIRDSTCGLALHPKRSRPKH